MPHARVDGALAAPQLNPHIRPGELSVSLVGLLLHLLIWVHRLQLEGGLMRLEILEVIEARLHYILLLLLFDLIE